MEFNNVIEEILKKGVEALNETNVSSRLSIRTPLRSARKAPAKTPGSK